MIQCPNCHGQGWVVVPADYSEGEGAAPSSWDICPECHGTGFVDEPVRTERHG